MIEVLLTILSILIGTVFILAAAVLVILAVFIKLALMVAVVLIPAAILFYIIKGIVDLIFWIYDRSRRA